MKAGPPQLGFSTRLALIVGAGFAALQLIMLGMVLVQNASQERTWRYPAAARLAAAAELVEATPAEDHERLLRALSSREARFAVGDAFLLEGYRTVERSNRMNRVRSRVPSLRARQLLILEPDRASARRGLGDWLTQPKDRKIVAVSLVIGGHLLVEPAQPGRRGLTILALLVGNSVLGLGVVAIVWTLTRRLAAPLEIIAERAATFASDLTAPAMDTTTGPPEARRMAEAFNQLRTDIQGLLTDRMRMLAAVAHDLKTYLTRLHMRTGLIPDPAHREAADRDIKHMASLIEDVILAARGDEIPTVLEPFDIGALLGDLVSTRLDSGVEVVASGVRRDMWGRGSAAGIRRALDNLIDNAVAYAGGAEISVSRQQDSWRICIIDHGPGLPPGFDEKALDPFTRGEPSRNRQTGGTGLGLFIANTLVRQSQADLVLTPTPGGGLTATVLIAATRRP